MTVMEIINTNKLQLNIYVFEKDLKDIGVVTEEYAEVLDEGLKNILILGVYNLSANE